jgi:hypothetical protein
VLKKIRYRWANCNLEMVAVLVLTVLAFSVRVHQIDFYSLSEDELAKWTAIQEYRHGHFVGVNSEHPMLPKMLAWASLEIGENWNRLAATDDWPSLKPEGWLRLPNVLFGAATTVVLYLLCRRMMGVPGSLATSFFWAVTPLSIALNRLMKEETPLTFFILLACYFYFRAKQADGDQSARHWYDLSAIGFGLALASQYILHLLGLNALAWFIAGKQGLAPVPSRFRHKRFYLVMFISFILVNPVILSPSNFQAILNWLHHAGVKHSGYDFDGTLYLNFPSRLLAGLPWFYYLWLLLVKTPIPILAAVVVGSILLVRDRHTLASCFFLSLGLIQLAGLSVSGAKWIRYSLPLLPFLYLAGGYAVQQTFKAAKEKGMSLSFVRAAAVIFLASPLLGLHAWAPYYSFYLNAIGGGKQKITRYFAPDEVSEFDTREVAQRVCPLAPRDAKLATARPMSMAYYLQACGRSDIDVVPLYDPHYVPQDGDFIVLEPSRRFIETQRFFDVLGSSSMLHSEVRVGPVSASTIYLFDSSPLRAGSGEGAPLLTQFHASLSPIEVHAQEAASASNTSYGLPQFTRRLRQ